jgi:aspartyl aminopeptidase
MAVKLEKATIRKYAKGLIDFINKGPSPYHVVDECKRQLLAKDFQELKEKDTWTIAPGGKYFIVNNFSTIFVIAVGGEFKPGNGFTIVGAHTDSPCLKVKPHSTKTKFNYTQVGVECYGGGIWHTWFDRDLTIAGRVVVRSRETHVHRLLRIQRPILRIPNICIHLARDEHLRFSPNKENHLVPILSTTVAQELNRPYSLANTPDHGFAHNHPPHLITEICKVLECIPENIMDFDLHLADTQPAAIGGLLDEFIFAPRMDNLFNCYTSLQGLFESLDTLEKDTNIRVVAMYDNEEVGSQSTQGAQSSVLQSILKRLSVGGSPVAYEEAIPKSFLVSADQAHAVHPNYADKHEHNHTPLLHGVSCHHLIYNYSSFLFYAKKHYE